MNAYICVTYALEDRDITDGFFRGLSRYGFRYDGVNEHSDPAKRKESLVHADMLIALTSPAAEGVETVGADIRHALERGMTVLCVSLLENGLDERYCVGSGGGAIRIPYPVGATPDRHSVALFVHRLFVRHLSRQGECFVELRCADDLYGSIIRTACHAHRGDGKACYALGSAYENGTGLPALENEAAYWMGLAAEQELPDALVCMGMWRLEGKGIERDPEAAFALFHRAAALGDLRGEHRVGVCYLEGLGVVMDPERGAECLERAALAGYAPSMYRLGCLYRDGIGVRRDALRARDCFYAAYRRECALRGETGVGMTVYGHSRPVTYTCVSLRHLRQTALRRLLGDKAIAPPQRDDRSSLPSANRCMGRNRYRLMESAERPDILTITKLYGAESPASAAEELSFTDAPAHTNEGETCVTAEAAFALGELLAAGAPLDDLRPAPTAALRWYRLAAEQGCVEALYVLAEAYRRGLGIPAVMERAVPLYRLAAEQGSLRGQFAYAVCCEQGLGIVKNPFTAAVYYEKAAEAGYAPAQHNLGGCYEHGRGVLRDHLLAVEWYTRAAESGLPDALCRLGICYEEGRGVEADIDKAIRLYEEAASADHGYALYRLGLYHHKRACAQGGEAAAVEADYHGAPREESDSESLVPRAEQENGRALYREGNDSLQALSLYRRATAKGSPDAAYALYICYRCGLGVTRDEAVEVDCLRRAAEGGCLQATYELGLCHMEGRGMPRNQKAAVACFDRAIALWRRYGDELSAMSRGEEEHTLPPAGMPLRRAVGGALYMKGFCVLYGLGETDRNRSVRAEERPAEERVALATPYFREAANISHVGALTMLGDLYAHGLLTSPVASSEDMSLQYYLEVGRVDAEATRSPTAGGDRSDSSVDALMSLAIRALRVAADADDAGDAELARVNAWRSFSEAKALGSLDALVGMAECLYHGWGELCNREMSRHYLENAMNTAGGRVSAALWMGDLLRAQWGGEPDPLGADAAYLQGLQAPCVESECGAYTLGLRRAVRRQADQETRVEVMYRLATLRAMYFSAEPDRRESFSYLAEAVLGGHAEALDDLARIYAYETTDPRAVHTEEAPRKDFSPSALLGKGSRLRRKLRRGLEDPTRSDQAARMHHTWLEDYYTALWPEPLPFSRRMRSLSVSRDVPAYVTATVTDLMRVNALCYLGECFFEGHGLPARPEAAVSCYRAALGIRLPQMRNQPLPFSVINATYSLGWCLLYGVGTEPNPAEAVRLLLRVARSHGGAAYTLGICYEEGRGVVIPEPREALKHYRKALRLGHPKAAERITRLEKALRAQEETT